MSMLRIFLVFLVGTLAWNNAVAQAPAATDSAATVVSASKVLVVPFEDKMFFTDIMRELSQGSGMPPEEVVSSLRNGIVSSIGEVLHSQDSTLFLHPDSLGKGGLDGIYEQLTYHFTPLRPRPKSPDKESSIHQGQLRTVSDTVERYMSAGIKDAEVLGKMSANKGAQRFIVLSQMEVRMDLSDPELLTIDPRYIVAVHYTVMDSKGNSLVGGLASRKFSKGDHNIRLMMFAAFPDIAKTIVRSEKAAKEPKTKSGKKAKD